MQTGRERTLKAIEFNHPDKIPFCNTINHDNPFNTELDEWIKTMARPDIISCGNADPEFLRACKGQDEWGCIWETIGYTMGEVIVNPLHDWSVFETWLSDRRSFGAPERYCVAGRIRQENPNLYIMGGLGFGMMNLINLRGYENFMTDLYLERENLDQLIEYLYSQMHFSVDGYSSAGLDAVILWEDWGLQNTLMISPKMWREVFKKPMAELIQYVHQHHMKYVLHSCGYITEILDDLIDIGVDVLQLDQQKLMGIDVLAQYAGSVCFFNPVDIQLASFNDDLAGIRRYAADMAEKLSTSAGGFMYKTYASPKSCEISRQVIESEVKAFTETNPYHQDL